MLSKWTRNRSSVASIRSSIRGDRIAVLAGEVGDVLPAVAVFGRLLPTPKRLDGCAEAVHLRAGVVVVVLALDIVPGKREEARDRVAVRPVAGRGNGDRAGGIRRDELDLDALRFGGPPAAEPTTRLEHGCEPRPEPGVVDREVEEPGARDLDPRDPLQVGDVACQLGRDVARRLAPDARELHRDVRRIVAVRCVGRALELDWHACDVREGSGERVDGIGLRHAPHRTADPCIAAANRPERRAARYSAGTAVTGRVAVAVPTVIPSRARAAATSSRAL